MGTLLFELLPLEVLAVIVERHSGSPATWSRARHFLAGISPGAVRHGNQADGFRTPEELMARTTPVAGFEKCVRHRAEYRGRFVPLSLDAFPFAYALDRRRDSRELVVLVVDWRGRNTYRERSAMRLCAAKRQSAPVSPSSGHRDQVRMSRGPA